MGGANAQMGILSVERNGFLGTNSYLDVRSARGFCVSPKPIFGVTLNLGSRNRFRSLGICTPGRRAAIVLASGEAGARSATEAVPEKELKFSPTFGDYVKVLESIRTDRSKHSNSDSDGSSSKYSPPGNDGPWKAENKGNKKLVDPRGRSRNTGVHTNRRSESYFDREQVALKRGDVPPRNEKNKKIDPAETSRSGWGLMEGTWERSRTWKNGNKSWGKDKSLRNISKHYLSGNENRYKDTNVKIISEHRLNNIIEGAHGRNLEKMQLDCFIDFYKKENSPRQNGNGHLHDRHINGKLGGRQSQIQRVDLKWKSMQLREHLDNSGRKVSESDIGKLENKNEIVGRTDFSAHDFQGTRSWSEGDKSCVIEKIKAIDESRIHESPLRRESFSTRNDGREKEHHMRRCQSGVLDMEPGRVQYNMLLSETEIDTTDHYGHSSKWNDSDNSKETNEEIRNRGHVVRFHGDDVMIKKFGSRISRIDKTQGGIDVKADKDAGRHVGNVDLDDRAAFKTFEVFTDVNNRPRVLRMELEERIQNLAKRLNATDVNVPEWKFSKLIHDAKIKFTDHSILRVVQILGAFGNWRRVLQVVEWLQSRERFKSYKSRYMYTTVLSVLGKAKRPMEALNVFFAMRKELSSYPDLAAYHCIAVILGQAGLMKELFDVIDCMRTIPEKKLKLGMLQKWDPRLEPDLVVYNAVLNACVQEKQWEGAFWVLQELKQKGIKPSNTTYGLVMEVMLACGKYNLVHEFFKKMWKNSIPGALNYKVLVNTFWREGKIDEAVLAVKDMERQGVVGSASLYYDLARCLCSAGRCQEALLQIDKLCKVAQKPLVVTYTGLIQTCLDSGSIENATYIFNQMQKFCCPNVVTCNIMLKSYVEHGMFQEAKSLFQLILEGNKDIKEKFDMRGKVVPDKFTFNTIMEACIDTKHWDDFENAYQQMLHYGYHFDAKRHLRMVMEASRAGKVQLLDTTCEHLICSGRSLPPAIVKERFCLRLQDGDCAAALSCLGIDQPGKSQDYSEMSWLNVLNTNFNRLGEAILIRLADEINNLPSEHHQENPIIQNLLNACKKIICPSTSAIDSSENQQTHLCNI